MTTISQILSSTRDFIFLQVATRIKDPVDWAPPPPAFSSPAVVPLLRDYGEASMQIDHRRRNRETRFPRPPSNPETLVPKGFSTGC